MEPKKEVEAGSARTRPIVARTKKSAATSTTGDLRKMVMRSPSLRIF